MTKDIKDYLHLYLGCEVMLDSIIESSEPNIKTLTAIQSIAPFVVLRDKGDSRQGEWVDMNNCKPILRPLSDMTEEEKKLFGIIKIEERSFSIETHFESFRLLLSKHFDLFGLIEAGLAIDKTITQ